MKICAQVALTRLNRKEGKVIFSVDGIRDQLNGSMFCSGVNPRSLDRAIIICLY